MVTWLGATTIGLWFLMVSTFKYNHSGRAGTYPRYPCFAPPPVPQHFFLDLGYPFLPSAHFLLSLFVTQEGNKLVGMSGNIDMNQSTTNLSHLPKQFSKSLAPSAKSCKNTILNYYYDNGLGLPEVWT